MGKRATSFVNISEKGGGKSSLYCCWMMMGRSDRLNTVELTILHPSFHTILPSLFVLVSLIGGKGKEGETGCCCCRIIIGALFRDIEEHFSSSFFFNNGSHLYRDGFFLNQCVLLHLYLMGSIIQGRGKKKKIDMLRYT